MASLFNKIRLINNDNTYSVLRMSSRGNADDVLSSNGDGTSDWKTISNTYLMKSGGTMTGDIVMDGNKITSYYTPDDYYVLTNKLYVDSYVSANVGNLQFSTGLISGGNIIQRDEKTFDVRAGVANFNNIENGVNTIVTWDDFTGEGLLPSVNSTYIWIGSNRTLNKSESPPPNSLLRHVVYLGVVNSYDQANISDIDCHPTCVIHTNSSFMDFCFAIGHINVSGNHITNDLTTSLGLSKSEGSIFAYGINFSNDTLNPHILFLSELITAGINYYMQNGNVSPDTNDVNSDVLDTGGNYPGDPVDSNKWTLQRIYSSSSANNKLRIIPGQIQYSNVQDAINAMATEIFTANSFVIAHSCFLYIMIIQQGTTRLRPNDNVFFYPQQNKIGGGGGSVSHTTLTNVGTGVNIVDGVTPYYNVKSISTGAGLSVSSNTTDIILENTSPASSISLTNGGAGTYSLISSTSVNPSLKNKTMSAGTGITIGDSLNNLTITNSSPASSISVSSISGGTSMIASTSSNPSFVLKGLTASTGISLATVSNNVQITNSSPASAITLTNSGTTSLIGTTSANPSLRVKGLSAGNNITLTTVGDDVQINASGTWSSINFQYQPTNFSGGGQVSILAQAYFKLEYAPCAFTTTQLKYYKLNTTSTTISFAIYNSAGSLLAKSENNTSTIAGLNTVAWNTPVTFTIGQPFYLAHSPNTGTTLSTLVFGVNLSPTLIPNSLYFYTNYWTSGLAPASVPIGSNTTSSCIMWYMLS